MALRNHSSSKPHRMRRDGPCCRQDGSTMNNIEHFGDEFGHNAVQDGDSPPRGSGGVAQGDQRGGPGCRGRGIQDPRGSRDLHPGRRLCLRVCHSRTLLPREKVALDPVQCSEPGPVVLARSPPQERRHCDQLPGHLQRPCRRPRPCLRSRPLPQSARVCPLATEGRMGTRQDRHIPSGVQGAHSRPRRHRSRDRAPVRGLRHDRDRHRPTGEEPSPIRHGGVSTRRPRHPPTPGGLPDL